MRVSFLMADAFNLLFPGKGLDFEDFFGAGSHNVVLNKRDTYFPRYILFLQQDGVSGWRQCTQEPGEVPGAGGRGYGGQPAHLLRQEREGWGRKGARQTKPPTS